MENRFRNILLFVFFIGLLIVLRLFDLQVLNTDFFKKIPVSQKQVFKNYDSNLISFERGEIFVVEKGEQYPIVVNNKKYNLVVSPNQIVSSDISPDKWIEKIAPYLGLENKENFSLEPLLIEESKENNILKEVLVKISKENDFYEVLKKDLSLKEMKEIKDLNLPGVSFEIVFNRFYSEKNLFSHVTGFTRAYQDNQENNLEIKGQYGIEKFFDKELSGREKNINNLKIENKTVKGDDLVLTLNRTIQFFTCQLLEEAINQYQAESGEIIVTNPKTGEIIALCGKPDFDPNNYSKVEDYSVFKNKVVDSSFEPGSIFKVITMAAGLDAGAVEPDTLYLDPGKVKIDGETISNVENRTFGYQDMTNVLEKSINTGAIFVAQETGRASFRNYLKKFGFGSLTQIEIPDESSGDISNLDRKQEIYLATASFGQGITVTPIQMVNAVGAIANQGRLMKPYLVKEIIKDGQKEEFEPQFIREVISLNSASLLTNMMVSVCENGYGSKARVSGYYVAGKTGTAQVPEEKGGYSEDVIHSFIGFAPATDPHFVALVKLNKPQEGKYADSTAVPTFGKLAEFILDYYNIPPDKED